MGILTDFVRQPDLTALDVDALYDGDVPVLKLKGLDPVKLDTLSAILGVRSPATGEPLWYDEEAGALLLPVAHALVRTLAAAGDATLDDAAARWVATDELRLDRWSLPMTREVLGEVRAFFRDALAAGESVGLFICP
jgi:hypothetical protein